MDKYKITKIEKRMPGYAVCLVNGVTHQTKDLDVFRIPDMKVGDNFYILTDKFDFDLVYICNGYVEIRHLPSFNSGLAIKNFDKNFRGLSDFSLDRIRYRRALTHAVRKMGIVPSPSAASNLRLWMSVNAR